MKPSVGRGDRHAAPKFHREDDVNEERYQRGKQVRESVLGQAHAARTAKNRTAFNADFQDFLMEYAWGSIWARPGLDHKTRARPDAAPGIFHQEILKVGIERSPILGGACSMGLAENGFADLFAALVALFVHIVLP